MGKMIVLKPMHKDAENDLIWALADSVSFCPDAYGLENTEECDEGCFYCWYMALTELGGKA